MGNNDNGPPEPHPNTLFWKEHENHRSAHGGAWTPDSFILRLMPGTKESEGSNSVDFNDLAVSFYPVGHKIIEAPANAIVEAQRKPRQQAKRADFGADFWDGELSAIQGREMGSIRARHGEAVCLGYHEEFKANFRALEDLFGKIQRDTRGLV